MKILSTIQRPNLEHAKKIFNGSIKYFFVNKDLKNVLSFIKSFTGFVNGLSESLLSKMIVEELDNLEIRDSTFIMNELIIYLMTTLEYSELKDYRDSALKLL
jgi:hypothetical protein